ncbi:hypothetical protein QZH41_012131, partial [Actinostola sp. cb2023]
EPESLYGIVPQPLLMSKCGIKHFETIHEADEGSDYQDSPHRLDSDQRESKKWRRSAMEGNAKEPINDMNEETSPESSRTCGIELSSVLDPNGMRVVRSPSYCSGMRQRSYTDPTDLLAVFRRRISTLDDGYNIQCTRDKTNDKEWSANLKISVDLNSAVQDDQVQVLFQKSPNERRLSLGGQKHSSKDSRTVNSNSDSKDMNDNNTPVERPLHERKISAPAVRMGRRNSQVLMQVSVQRRCSVAGLPARRMGRRGSEVPALTSLARRRSITPAYPVGLKGRGARGFSNTEKRLQVTNEILETEKKYLACLNTLKQIFEDPLREENLIGVKEIDVIFPNELGLIRDSHTLFMKELDDRIRNWKQYGIVGDIFTKLSSSYHIDVLKIYSDYVNNFPKAIAVINKYSRGSQKFRRFLQNCSSEPECEGLDLAAYLLTPIQRLPRYVLLLRQLSKCTDASHPDSFHLENALETMKNMINILNDSIHNSCKIVSTSANRKSSKRRSLRKRTSLKELKIIKDDNDNKIVQVSSPTDSSSGKSPKTPVSVTSSVESPTSNPSSPQASSTHVNRHSSGFEHSFLTRLRSGDTKSRPVSTGDLDNFYHTDHAKEYNAIVEEGEGKDDKATGQSKLKTAAESVRRSWQRRSKKWRRSFEGSGRAISTNGLPELGKDAGVPNIVFTHPAEKFQFDDITNVSPTISPVPSNDSTPMSGSTDALKAIACNPSMEGDEGHPSSPSPSPAISTTEIVESVLETTEASESATHDVVTIEEQEDFVLQTFPDKGSPYTRHRQVQRKNGVQERPLSVALPMKDQTDSSENTLEDKSKSDNDILNSEDTAIWIQRRPHLQQQHSDGAVRHGALRRKSSTLSSDRTSGTTGTSIGSLDTSKDSLIDSIVSGDTTDDSPSNTLRKTANPSRNMNDFTQLSIEERLGFDEVDRFWV